jgi:hypothetical protein
MGVVHTAERRTSLEFLFVTEVSSAATLTSFTHTLGYYS